MISYKVYNQKGETVSDIELSDKVFGQKKNEALVHQAVVAQMSNERKVLAHTKDRSEVRGGGKKPWRQKGTGRARAGSSRSPIWIGGGVTFGPTKNRNFSKDLNVKMKQKAMCVVLSDKVACNNLAVLDNLAITEYKTKDFKKIVDVIDSKILPNEGKKGSLLMIDAKPEAVTKSSARNLTNVKLITVENVNLLDIIKYKNIVVTQEALKVLEERYK
ncbi:MAG: 50S ribosomal protein L4 [Candidatus Falkowbacteria bacterium]|nr:50S ribosomal protein L4 [Candidatus Falkowbacteria bacterium]